MQIACNPLRLHAIFVESGGRKFVGWEISCNFVALKVATPLRARKTKKIPYMKTKSLIFGCLMAFVLNCMPAAAQRAMTADDLAAWQRISERQLSDDGAYLACAMTPWWGDGHVLLYSTQGALKHDFFPAEKFAFTKSGKWLVVQQNVPKDTLDLAKIKKVKKNKMPLPNLLIHNITTGANEAIDSIKSFKVSHVGDWIAYRRTHKDSTLVVRSANGALSLRYADVAQYGFAKESSRMWYVVGKNKKSDAIAGLYLLDPATSKPVLVKAGEDKFSQVTISDNGELLSFLYSPNKKEDYKNTELWLSKNGAEAQQVSVAGIPEGWVVSKFAKLNFSDNGALLYFGASPVPQQTDTTKLAANRPNVQVWSYDEPVQYTVQSYNLKTDLKKNYTAVYHLNSGKVVQLSTEALPDFEAGITGNGDYALISDSRKYSNSSMWEGRTRSDYYSVNLATGAQKLVSEADYTTYKVSPAGKYAYGYNETDSCWYTISLADGVRHRITTPATFIAWDEEDDHPDYPMAYGAEGWTEGDAALLLRDRYDIWQFNPMGSTAPICLTKNGRKTNIQYRCVNLDKDQKFLDTSNMLLHGFNVVTRDAGYYSLTTKKGKTTVTPLHQGAFMLRDICKAKDCNTLVYTEETYTQFPDLIATDLTFAKRTRITEGYKQQEQFKWGSVELVSWTNSRGVKLDGMLFRPANFDANKKYPMIVNFYERYSETLHNYHMPQPGRSTVEYHLYDSNDYVLFCPDIRYSVQGTPGEDCYDCVMSGIEMVVNKGFINEKAIGAQGHSWGGYQVAYLATRTNKFAAIESGAPVVNMFSAYGGIRWGSGLARAFQYEHTQSRVGGSPWEVPELYKANSPLFNIDKVTTPILIMHNDQDGHVPWYQGIEYFVAMKRNHKPCWMLNYTGEVHWPLTMPNRIDFQRRMKQFFDHYLQGAPMPQWMSEGVPAVKQKFELGY